MTALVLACRHEIPDGAAVVLGPDEDGYALVAVLGRDMIPLEDLREALCDECESHVKIVGVR